jgi:hypothetical protein
MVTLHCRKNIQKGLSNIFDSVTSVANASRAFSIIVQRNAFSVSTSSPGLPTGWTIPAPLMILMEPIIEATGVIVQIWAVGIQHFSNSFVIAAPQRVLEPQVEVKIAPSTPSAVSCFAISIPTFCEFERLDATPAVVRNTLCS